MKIKILTLLFACTALFFQTSPVYSAGDGDMEALKKKSGSGGGTVTINNPIGTADPNVIIGYAIQAIMGLVGAVSLLMIVYGGLTWMMAAGNKDKVTKGKDIILWTALGMLVIFSSYAIIKFILDALKVGGT